MKERYQKNNNDATNSPKSGKSVAILDMVKRVKSEVVKDSK